MSDFIPGSGTEERQEEYTPMRTPKQSNGGTFATEDMQLLKRALRCYKDTILDVEMSDRAASSELTKVANLLHRIGRIA
jgi:hypothetical protein